MAKTSRIDALRSMVEARPEDPRARFGLALEYERMEQWEDVVRELRTYLSLTADEGNAYGRFARALHMLGRDDEAKVAYQEGIEAAERHNHPTMVEEFEEAIEAM